MVSAPSTNGHANGFTNGHANGHHAGNGNGHANGNGHVDVHSVCPTAAVRPSDAVTVNAPNVEYSAEHITAKYEYASTVVKKQEDGKYQVTPTKTVYEFRTQRVVPKVGLMLVGLGGNNGTTLAATVLANKHNIHWNTKSGEHKPNYYGSLLRASTLRLGVDAETGDDVNVPFSDLLPMVHPNDLVVGGWDISSLPLDKAMERAQVLDYDLQRQLAPYMAEYKPLPSIYYPTWINANQTERADNLLPNGDRRDDKATHLEAIRGNIRDFKAEHGLDKVIVLWTANTERYAQIVPGVNDTADNILKAVEDSHDEIAPSTLFAIAAILEGAPYINGAPQNTFVPGVIELAEKKRAFIAGDDFKSGQTKVKSVLAEFLVNAGIKPLSIASYNHLGNNDGCNLSAPEQFRSKEISKSSVVDDMVAANELLFPKSKGGKPSKGPDHTVVIKYMPSVGDDKRAIDEYYSEILLGGHNVISIFNV